MTTTDRLLCAVLALGLLAAGCGDPDSTANTGTGGAGEPAAAAQEDDRLAPVDTKGDPRDMVSFSVLGTAQTFVRYDTYEQLRDYTDLSMIGTVEKITVAEPYEEPYLSPGQLQVDMTVDAVLGGQVTDVSVGDSISVVLPFNATEKQWATYGGRLDALRGARFAMFLVVKPAPEGSSRRFSPKLYNAPPAILAEWPGDGRLTDLKPHDFLALEAVERGVEKTGVPYEGEAEWAPTFEGGGPIGMTVAEAARDFAGTSGRQAVDPPEGWDARQEAKAAANGG